MEFDFKNEFESMMKSNELDTVVVLGHINPDGDAAGSVMGIAHYIGVNYPEYQVFPYLADTIDKGPKLQVNQDKKFYPFEKPDLQGKRFATVICDTATLARLSGREFYEASAASIVIDHHASNEGYGDRNYTKVSEACAVNVFYSLNQDDLKKAAEAEEYPNAADYVYLGIVHDTNAFQRADESIMKAATKLLELGVDHRRIIQTRQIDTLGDLEKRADILKNAIRVLDGKVAYVCINKEEKVKKNISYEEIHPISSILRDCVDIELGFTMYEEEPDRWRCSFRSDGKWIDVNELITPFGGGGHAGAAGLRKRTSDMEELRSQILEKVKKLRAEKCFT